MSSTAPPGGRPDPGHPASPTACSACLARSRLLARLSGHLDVARARLQELLELGDDALVVALSGDQRDQVRRELSRFDAGAYRRRCAELGLELVCRCDRDLYPGPLRALAAPPAVLHVAGGARRLRELAAGPAVAVVGARRASPYGLEVARSLSRGVSAAQLAVVSGMAHGIDAAAHEGALQGATGTVAVLPAAPHRPYPPAARALHRRILAAGCAVSELGPDVPVRRWMFPARNRIIAGLSAMTVLVAARERSGAMLTARLARELGRELGAVPGQVTAPLSWGPHELIKAGARPVTEPGDVLTALFGAAAPPAPIVRRPAPDPELAPLLAALADGHDPPRAFAQAGLDADQGLAALAALELAGHVRRQAGGRFSVLP